MRVDRPQGGQRLARGASVVTRTTSVRLVRPTKLSTRCQAWRGSRPTWDGTDGWNCEHPIYELVEVRLDRGECLNDSFAGIWRQLVEQASQLIKFGGGFGDSRNSGLRGRFVLDA